MKNSLRLVLIIGGVIVGASTVFAQGLTSFSLSEGRVVGGSYVLATATLDSAPLSGLKVAIKSSDRVAVPNPGSLYFATGKTSQTVGIQTLRVFSTHVVTLTSNTAQGSLAATLIVDPLPSGASRNFINAENSLAGTSDWELANPSKNGEIQAYAGQWSIPRGGVVDLYVSTTAPSFDIDVYRLGYYGGAGGRLAYSVRNCVGQSQGSWNSSLASPTNSTAILHNTVYYTNSLGQQVPEDTRVRDANWQKTFTFSFPTRLITGMYLIKLTESATGTQWYVPMVVRDDTTAAPYIFAYPCYTDQVYNNWGGSNGYSSSDPQEGRSMQVSFNRPNAIDSGAGWIRCWTFQMLSFLEQNGYEVSYTSSNDIGENLTDLTKYKAYICPGHDEYWTQDERYYLQQAINNNNLSVAFFGANDMYEQVREESDLSGHTNRFLACYKGYPDPMTNQKGSLGISLNTTVWDHLGLSQQLLLKTDYVGFGNVKANFCVLNSNHWAYANTGLADGSTITNLVGYEVDGVLNTTLLASTGHTITVLGNSPFTATVGTGTKVVMSNCVIDEYPNGNLMFSAGTIFWPLGLTNYWPAGFYPWWRPVTPVSPALQQMTMNILDRMVQHA